MILKNITILNNQNVSSKQNLYIGRDKIVNSNSIEKNDSDVVIEFPFEVIAFPGLTNSHEHLTLNTHPIHKNKTYVDYVEWTYDNFEKTIEEINSVPFQLKYEWGILKNVLHGFTTILQHDAYLKNYTSKIADIYTDTLTIHSLTFDKKWKLKALLPFSKKKIIHIAEGTSSTAKNEFKKFSKWCLNSKNILAVHGISLEENETKKIGGLIWCPNSNMHLYEKTADIKRLKKSTPILFGTDSTVSSDWNLWKHLKQARNFNYLSDQELFDSITKTPAKIFNWKNKGSLKAGAMADIVIAKKSNSNFYDSFYSLESKDILLIVKSGNIIFYDDCISEKITIAIDTETFEKIEIQRSIKFVRFGINSLVKKIQKYHPDFSFESYFKIL